MEITTKNRIKSAIEYILITAVIILALCLRIHSINTIQYKMEYDALNYHNMANQFLEKGFLGYPLWSLPKDMPNAYVTPGYPLFLSLIYKIVGNGQELGIMAVKFVQAILSTLSVLIIYLIGKRIKSPIVGIIAAVMASIYPTFLVVTAYHLTETLYLFVFLLYLYLQIISNQKNSKLLNFITGIIFGAAVLVRPTVFPLFIVVYLFEYFINKNKKALKNMIFFILGLVLIMLPWWIRNIVTMGEFILLCTQSGNPLLGGAYPPWIEHPSFSPENQTAQAIEAIINGFRYHTADYLYWFTWGKLKIIYGTQYLVGMLELPDFIKCIHIISISLGTIGIIVSIFKKEIRLIALYLVMLTCLQLLFIPESRYAFPIMPLFMILTGYVINWLIAKIFKINKI